MKKERALEENQETDLNITKNVNTNLYKNKTKTNIHTLTEEKKERNNRPARPYATDNYTVNPLDSRLCVTEIIWR